MYRQSALATPAVWLEIVGAELDVPRPDEDGWGYGIPPLDLGEGPSSSPGPALIRLPGRWPGGPPIIPSGACLDAFIRLADVPDDRFGQAVLAFARRWGPLDLCRHQLPRAPGRCSLLTGSPFRMPSEPLVAWRRYSCQLLALLNIGARLQQGEYPDRADWERLAATGRGRPSMTARLASEDCLTGWDDSITIPELGAPFDRLWNVVIHVLNAWWRYSNVRPESYRLPGQNTAKTRWTHDGLAAVLSIQIAAAIGDRLYTCDDCGYPFTLREGRRRPARGRNAYCETCSSNGGRSRVAQRKRYWKARGQARPSR